MTDLKHAIVGTVLNPKPPPKPEEEDDGGWVSMALDAVGAVPVAGDLVDGGRCLNGLATGDHDADTALTCAAVVPVFGSDATAAKVGLKASDELVDLTSTARRTHILDGEVFESGGKTIFSGGHRSGTGFPNKSEFPKSWSDDLTMHHISDVATDPSSTFSYGKIDTFAEWYARRHRRQCAYQERGDMDGVPDERPQEPDLTARLYAYRDSVVAFVDTFADRLTEEESRQVHHLINHGEPIEGLVYLAWFVVDAGRKISQEEHDNLLSLIGGSESRRFLPPNLSDAISS